MISQRLHRHLPDLGLHIESGGTQTSHTEGACVSGLQTPDNAAGCSVLVGTPHSTTVSSEREARQGKTAVCRLTLPPLTPRRTAPRVPAPAPGSPEQEPSLVPLITNSAVQLCSHTINITSWWRTNPLTSGPTDFPSHLSPDSKPRPTANGGLPTQAPRRHSTHATESRAGGLPHEPTGRRPTNPQPTTQPLR
jgi:hypothetical protein